MMWLTYITLAIVIGKHGTECYPTGAPDTICIERGMPHHQAPPSVGGYIHPQSSPPPFTLIANASTYSPGDVIQVTLQAKEDMTFKGFQMTAWRKQSAIEELQGSFISYNETLVQATSWFFDSEIPNCITHTDNEDKTQITVLWKAPDVSQGDIIIRSSAVHNYTTFWMDIRADVITASESDAGTDITYPEISADATDLSWDSCGKTQGCHFLSRDAGKTCSGTDCDVAVGFKQLQDSGTIQFQILGPTGHDWVAIAWSDDKAMGDDLTIHCISDNTGFAGIYKGYSPGLYNIRQRATELANVEVEKIDDRVACKFTRPMLMGYVSPNYADHTVFTGDFNLNNTYYLQMAWGRMFTGTTVPEKHHQLPSVSKDKINFLKAGVSGEVEVSSSSVIKMTPALLVIAMLTTLF